eukprot:m.1416869 g.1416869  ORF g.1416869 m.1416869 type:complete len:253 (-) comp25032_c0_seq2:3736-4494(-)
MYFSSQTMPTRSIAMVSSTALLVSMAVFSSMIIFVIFCIGKKKKSHTTMEGSTVEMTPNPMRGSRNASTSPSAADDGPGMPRPRVREDFDARPMTEKLQDLASDLNKAYGTTPDAPEHRRLSVPQWAWPATGQPRWQAPPPPSEPVPVTPTQSWATTQRATEEKLFGKKPTAGTDSTEGGSVAALSTQDEQDGYLAVSEDEGDGGGAAETAPTMVPCPAAGPLRGKELGAQARGCCRAGRSMRCGAVETNRR